MATTLRTRPLKELWEAWIEKFRRMDCDPRFAGNLNGPHITFKPDGYDLERKTVLYVGKALGKRTRNGDLPSAEACQNEFRRILRAVVSGEYGSAFWNFALELSQRLAGQEGPRLENLVWSNICKIGVRKGNPGKEIFEEQKCLAIETLRAEIKYYKPSLVMWVTGNYGGEVVRQVVEDANVVEDPNKEHWEKSPEDKGVYFRRRMHSLPAMLWTYHPQGQHRQDTDLWIREACKLLNLKG
jgi:hypothetical protein